VALHAAAMNDVGMRAINAVKYRIARQ